MTEGAYYEHQRTTSTDGRAFTMSCDTPVDSTSALDDCGGLNTHSDGSSSNDRRHSMQNTTRKHAVKATATTVPHHAIDTDDSVKGHSPPHVVLHVPRRCHAASIRLVQEVLDEGRLEARGGEYGESET